MTPEEEENLLNVVGKLRLAVVAIYGLLLKNGVLTIEDVVHTTPEELGDIVLMESDRGLHILDKEDEEDADTDD